jgi:hypothetical protein
MAHIVLKIDCVLLPDRAIEFRDPLALQAAALGDLPMNAIARAFSSRWIFGGTC